MRLRILFAITIVTFLLGVYFLFKPQNEVVVASELKGHNVTFKNKDYLLKKINELDYWNHSKINRLRFVLSATPQYVPLGFHGSKNDKKIPEVSIAYGADQQGKTQTLILYVNPDMYPISDLAQLEHQYTQVALLSLFRMAAWKKPKTPETTKQFVSDYRANITNNKIFSIE